VIHDVDDAPTAAGSRTVIAAFERVRFGYEDGAPVLEDVGLSIEQGEVLTLLGASGCGKSTLLKMVAGLLRPQGGHVSFQGHPLEGINTRVGYMTQDDTLLPWRTLRANLALALTLGGTRDRHTVRDRVRSHLEMVDLADHGDLYPAQLSGGMKRRALLARSVITEPVMVLMDEPFAAIDADLREELHAQMRATVERLDQTVLFVTHDISEAALLSDRVAVIGGRPVATVRKVIDIPFGRDRDLEALRTDDRYFHMQTLLRDALRAEATNRD
jgi:NitT/TauT family transport system ATP-binding protein